MLSVIIPAHNEEDCIAQSVTAAFVATLHPKLMGEAVSVIVIADACSDQTAAIALGCGAIVIEINQQNVGAARACGATAAIAMHARWLAFTDADSLVARNWLVDQLLCEADAVCGTISVSRWPLKSEAARLKFLSTYKDVNGHTHIHGANFGVSTHAYLLAGGFQPLKAHEDVALVQALYSVGASICWSAAPRVETSVRLMSRTGEGFGATLQRWNSNHHVLQDGLVIRAVLTSKKDWHRHGDYDAMFHVFYPVLPPIDA